jgi:hypothetical protein
MIHPAYNLFLAIYLAHLLTDFVFQTSRLVSKKRRGDWHGYVIHGVTHYVLVLATVALADPHRFPTPSFQLVAVSLSIIHLLVDWAKVSSNENDYSTHKAMAALCRAECRRRKKAGFRRRSSRPLHGQTGKHAWPRYRSLTQ